MKITLVVTGLGLGGAEKQVVNLAEKFHEKGNQVKIIYLTPLIKQFPKYSDIELIPLNLRKNPISLFMSLIKFKKIIDNYKPSVIHSHMVHANIFCRISKILTPSIPIICSAHNSNEGNILRTISYRITDRLCELTTNVSSEAIQSFEKKRAIKKNKMRLVFNGIDTKLFHPKNNNESLDIRDYYHIHNKLFFFTAGRLTDAKDHHTLINSIYHVKKVNKNIRLLIAGEGPNRTSLQAEISRLNLDNEITLIGNIANVAEFMRSCDCFILSSAWEGLPLVIGEAMSSQKIVITTNCSGAADYLGNSHWISPKKDPIKLSNKIIDFINLNIEIRNLEEIENRKTIENKFSLEKISEEWLRIYKEIIYDREK